MPKDAERGKAGGTPFRKEKAAMEQILQNLQSTAARLNDTADAANELIRSANERLGTIGAGVAFWSRNKSFELRNEERSRYDEDKDREEHAGYDAYVLSYAKIHGTWQLGVRTQHFLPGEDRAVGDYYVLAGAEEEPLLNADRELRIKAAAVLPEFLRAYTTHLAALADKLRTDTEE